MSFFAKTNFAFFRINFLPGRHFGEKGLKSGKFPPLKYLVGAGMKFWKNEATKSRQQNKS